MSGIFWSWEQLLIDLNDELGRSLKLPLLERKIRFARLPSQGTREERNGPGNPRRD
jgi:hypothetical protein